MPPIEASASTGRAQHGARAAGGTRCMALATRLGAQLPLPSLAAALPAAADVRCELLSPPPPPPLSPPLPPPSSSSFCHVPEAA